jgi:hypothetical protein
VIISCISEIVGVFGKSGDKAWLSAVVQQIQPFLNFDNTVHREKATRFFVMLIYFHSDWIMSVGFAPLIPVFKLTYKNMNEMNLYVEMPQVRKKVRHFASLNSAAE